MNDGEQKQPDTDIGDATMAALVEKRAQVESILRSCTQFAIVTTDLRCRITYFNPKAEEIFGCRGDEVVGRRVRDIALHKEIFAKPLDRVMETLRQQGKLESEIELPGGDGTTKTLQSTAMLMRDAAGRKTGYILFAVDVTEQRQSDARLRQLSRAVEQSPASVMITNISGKIDYVNPKFVQRSGYAADEILGKNPRMLKSGHQSHEVYENLWKTITAGNEWEGEFCNKSKSGELYWELACISAIRDDNGTITGFVAVKEDITERKRLEEKLRNLSTQLCLTEEHERRRLAVDLHDRISQTLAVCRMKLGAARAAVDSDSDGGALLHDIDQMLQQTIHETRTLTFELCPPILYELGLVAAVEWLGEQIQARHGLSVQCRHDGQPIPLTDDVRSALFRIVSELLNNVAKHADAQLVCVSILRMQDLIRIEVEDDGCGFDASALGRPETGNGGFGLFSIRQRMEVLGGSLTIDNQRERGTRVVLSAPLFNKGGGKPTASMTGEKCEHSNSDRR